MALRQRKYLFLEPQFRGRLSLQHFLAAFLAVHLFRNSGRVPKARGQLESPGCGSVTGKYGVLKVARSKIGGPQACRRFFLFSVVMNHVPVRAGTRLPSPRRSRPLPLAAAWSAFSAMMRSMSSGKRSSAKSRSVARGQSFGSVSLYIIVETPDRFARGRVINLAVIKADPHGRTF